MGVESGQMIYLERIIGELKEKDKIDESYLELYSDYPYELKVVLSSYHNQLNEKFEYMNYQLGYKYFHAEESRKAILLFKKIDTFLRNFKSLGISISKPYKSIIERCREVLSFSGGTKVPESFKEIKIIEVEPIFVMNNVKKRLNLSFTLSKIGEGSYAEVYKYYDEYYDKEFVLKKAKSDLDSKGIERLKKEYLIMKKNPFPNIVEVYRYDDEKKEYSMELMDSTLFDYIDKNNKNISLNKRFALINQLLRVFRMLERKEILHRDISYFNVLIKKYENSTLVKLSDFGLVKIEESNLTSLETDVKGSLNDFNDLNLIGFKNYSIVHETYALTKLIIFILTGKRNFHNIKDNEIMKFLKKGTGEKKDRFQSIEEMSSHVKELFRKLKDK